MKYLLLITLVGLGLHASAQRLNMDARMTTDATATLQAAFNKKDVTVVSINNSSMQVNGTLKIPAGKTLRFEAGCKLTGKGTINGGIIDASYLQQIFDTSLTVNPEAVNGYFSVKWFGAKGKNTDDYAAIQQSINTCIRNNIRTVFIPIGNYKISKPLILRGTGTDKNRNFCTLEILGESTFWDSNMGSEINPMFTDGFAFGIQRGKGCKIRKLRINGKFKPPFKNDKMKFYNASFEEFTDSISRDNRYSPYAAIVIDPFTNVADKDFKTSNMYPGLEAYYGTNGNSVQSGSTGTELEELSVNGFVVGICSSPNGLTRNAEITIINKVQFSNCKLAISGGQDQEKANIISNIYCWGGTHTIFGTDLYGGKRMAGNWNISNVNIAGGVVRFIYNNQHGYFASYISHVYAESLGSWGTINSQLATEVSNCNIDFEYPSRAGNQVLITSYGKNVVYRSCNFRYYGEKTEMIIDGDATFEKCYFSGPVVQANTRKNNAMFPFGTAPIGGWNLFKILLICFTLIGIAILYKKKIHQLLFLKRSLS